MNQAEIGQTILETTRGQHMKRKLIKILIFTLPTTGSAAENPCKNIQYSQQVAQCAEYEKEKYDNLLNLSYRAVIERIKAQYASSPELSKQYIDTLKKAQQAWIKLRDADCKLEAFQIEETAEAHQTTINSCISRMSKERSTYLEKISPTY